MTIHQFPRVTARAVGYDRASVSATAILLTIRSALLAWLQGDTAALSAVRAEVEEILRDELDDAVRTAISEIRASDD